MVKLSERLQIIYGMVPKCDTICDVGCDHGYLAISLLEGGVCNHAVAMDVNKGPLNSAKENVRTHGLSDKVDFRLSDGLSKLTVSEADTICICGMGGALITRILDAGIDVAKSAKTLIVEPQSEYDKLREFLAANHFSFLDEELCIEEGKIYPIIKVSYTPDSSVELSRDELLYGPVIIKKKLPLLARLLDKNKNEYLSILEKLSSRKDIADGSPIQKRIDELEDELCIIERLISEMEG